jgi:hypothetical protein
VGTIGALAFARFFVLVCQRMRTTGAPAPLSVQRT